MKYSPVVLGIRNLYEHKFVKTLVVVDETLNRKLGNTTYMLENKGGMGLFPFIYRCKNQDRGGSSLFDIVVALIVFVVVVKTLKQPPNVYTLPGLILIRP